MTPKHYYEEKYYYFITTITEKRIAIFKDKLACELFLNILTYYKFSCNYNVFAFVIMPDHIHLVLQPTGKENISEIVKKLKGCFSRYYNKIYKTTGAIFQKGFYDVVIRNEAQLNETIEYIHYNPVKKGIVTEAKAYPYSSHNYFYEMDERYKFYLAP